MPVQMAAKEEDGAPTEACLQGHRRGTAQRRADAVTRRVDADGQATPPLGGVFAGNHVGAGQDPSDPQARNDAPDPQLQRRMRQGGEQHAGGCEAD